ncbi:M56 family metallopeptidase [Yeosuana sp. MJ-SS3]|uniref:M56 family metallopeptidase n=1 Tax=Gilvirhabdus luticola TaxID=3079858 RepID=A0ABU3U6M5_9FLAO|nr:M56 family metallopeptidase [Yeosuana sp. MJ-SS3]MDU8886045.1 M56 family metallopeptidase [Yeosuana sp. MJ-SS3]
MEYLLKASAIIAIFYICYKVFLQKETFFQSNRWFLLLGLIIAFVFPFIVIPIYIEAPINNLENIVFENATITSESENTFDILQLVFWIYILGGSFFLGRFLIQIFSLRKLLLKTTLLEKNDKYVFLKTNEDITPFSFFNWIVYNPNQFNDDELNQVLIHEKVHVRQHHSLDILISQISAIVFWFNPFIWFYKKEMQQNLEFIADYFAQSNITCKKKYQYLLLKSSVPTYQLGLTNNFYNSLIKKRIVMLHKSKSKQSKQFKYLLIIPFLSLFLMSFNTKNVYIEKDVPPLESIASDVIYEKASPVIQAGANTHVAAVETLQNNTASSENNSIKNNQNIAKISKDNQMVIITKDFTDNDFDKVKEQLKKEGLTVKFKNVKRNDSGEITGLKIDVSSKESNANYNINGDEPIKPIKISFDKEGNNISIGNGHYHYKVASENEFYFSDDETEDVKVHVAKVGSSKKLHTVATDKNVIHIHSDTDVEFDDDKDIIILKKDKDGNIVKDTMEDEDVFVVGDDNSFKVKSIGKGKNKVLFLNSEEGEPLIIIDDNEATEKDMNELDSDKIEKMEVLKGNSAIEKYGDKGKNGVILITTK